MRHTFLDFFTYLWFFYSLSSYGTESPMSSNETAALLLPLCAHTYSIMLLLRQHQCRNFKESYSNTFEVNTYFDVILTNLQIGNARILVRLYTKY